MTEQARNGLQLIDTATATEFTTHAPGGPSRLRPTVSFGGDRVAGDELVAAVRASVERSSASASVAHASGQPARFRR